MRAILALLGVAATVPGLPGLADAPLVVRGEVVARGGHGPGAWTTVVIDSVLVGTPGASAVTFEGGSDLELGQRAVLPLEKRRGGFRVPDGAVPIVVQSTAEIERVEAAVRALPPAPAWKDELAAALAGAIAFAGLLGVALRRRLP